MAVSILLLFLLPGSPDHPQPLISKGIVRFTPKDQSLLRQRIERDDVHRRGGAQGLEIPLRTVKKTVFHYKRWLSLLSTSVVFSTWSPLITYTPSIYVSLGFDRVAANALASVGATIALGVVFFFAWLSDRTGRRGLTVMLAQLVYLVALIICRQVQDGVGRWSKWGLWTVVNSFAVGYHPVHNTWLQLNCRDPGERSISIAMWVMFAIGGLMYGTQFFQGDDAKAHYPNGLRTMIILVAVGIVLALLQELVYWHHNRKVKNGTARVLEGESKPRVYVL